jgi:RND family efflux transporter MFP subunit
MIRTIPRVLALSAGVGLLAVTAACGVQGSPPADHRPANAGRPPVAVTVTPAAASELVDAVDVVGSLSAKATADVKSEVTGVVTAVYVTEWVAVRKGAPLARLDTSESEAAIDALKAVEAQALVAEARARREYNRALQLKQYGLITPQGLDEAQSIFDAARAATTSSHAQVRMAEARLAKSLINAPMDGVVSERRVNVGDRVENMGSGDPMFRVIDNRLLDLTVSVPTARLSAVHVGQRLEFSTDTHPERTFTGSVNFINPAVDPVSRSAKVVASVPNADGLLRAGLFVRGRIVVSARRDVLQVPREALLNWNVASQSAEVFVVREGQAQKRTVRIGTVSERSVEIVSGVAIGDQVVTRGGFALRPGDRVTTAAAGEGA